MLLIIIKMSIYILTEVIYLLELKDGYYCLSLKEEKDKLKNKYLDDLILITKYKCYESKVLLLRLKNNYKSFKIKNELFKFDEDTIIKFKESINNLIEEINIKLLNNSCSICEYTSYRNENFNNHMDSKLHNKRNEKNKIIQLTEENKRLKKENEKLKKEKTINTDLTNNNSNKNITNNIITGNNNDINNDINITNNNNTTNITNNIKIVAFGEEDIDNIPHSRMIHILDAYYASVYKLIECVHVNIFKKENKNIYIKKDKGYVYNGTEYIECNINELMEKLIKKKIRDVKKIFKKCKKLNDDNELEDINNKFTDKFEKNYIKLFENDFNYETVLKKTGGSIKLLLEYVEEVFENNISILKSFL